MIQTCLAGMGNADDELEENLHIISLHTRV